MGRFYKTATPDFVEDFMYTPPWELAGKVMEANEQGIQNTLASTSIFSDFDIQHIEDPVLKEQATGIKDKYSSSADEITKTLQSELASNPQAWRSHLPKIGKLAKELQKDFKSGDIFKMMSDSQRASTWKTENKEAIEKNPELANAAYNAIMTDFRSDPDRKKDWNAGGFDKLSKFDINSKEILDAVKEYEARTVQNVRGDGFIEEIKYKDKNELVRNYMNTVLADPEAQRYMQQATALGLPGFVDKNGKPIPLKVPINLETKERVSEEEFNREREKFLDPDLSKEDRIKQGRLEFKYDVVPNSEFAWTRNFEGLADRIGGEISRKYTADPVYSAEVKRRHDYSLAQFKHGLGLEKLAVEDAYRAKKEEQKAYAELSLLNDELAAMEASGDTSSKEYNKKKAKRDGIASNNVDLVRDNYNNVNFEKSQSVLSSSTNNIEKEYIRNIDNNVLDNALTNSEFDIAYKSIKEGDTRFQDFNYRVVETYLHFNDRMQEIMGESVKNKRDEDSKGDKEIKEYLISEKGYKPEDLSIETTIKVRDQYSGVEQTQTVLSNTPWFDNLKKGLNKITEKKKASYAGYSTTHQDNAIAGIRPEMEQKIRNEYYNGESAYDFIPASLSVYKDGQYTDPTNKNKPVKFPTKEDMLDSSKVTFSGVTPHSPVGITPILNYEGNKFYMVNNQGVTEATERNRRLYLDENGYVNSDSFKMMEKNIRDAGHRTIVNSLTELKALAQSGVSKQNTDMPRWEVNNSTGEPIIGPDGKPKELRDPRTGKVIPSEYNEVAISSGIGEVFSVREYYNSGRSTPFVLYKDGEFATSGTSLLLLTREINDYISKRAIEINSDNSKEDPRKDYEIKE